MRIFFQFVSEHSKQFFFQLFNPITFLVKLKIIKVFGKPIFWFILNIQKKVITFEGRVGGRGEWPAYR